MYLRWALAHGIRKVGTVRGCDCPVPYGTLRGRSFFPQRLECKSLFFAPSLGSRDPPRACAVCSASVPCLTYIIGFLMRNGREISFQFPRFDGILEHDHVLLGVNRRYSARPNRYGRRKIKGEKRKRFARQKQGPGMLDARCAIP